MSLEMLENKRKRLIFRSGHRGTKEMDLIMGSFAIKNVPNFTLEQIEVYEQILEISDVELYNWYTGKEDVPPEEKNEMLQSFLAHKVV